MSSIDVHARKRGEKVNKLLLGLLLLVSFSVNARPVTVGVTFDPNPVSEGVTAYKAQIRVNSLTPTVYNGTDQPAINIPMDANSGDVISAQVSACNSKGCSVWSASVSATVPAVGTGGGTGTTVPAVVTGVAVTIIEGQ